MGMFSEAATEGTVSEVVSKLKPLYEAATGERKEGYRQAILVALTCFEWSEPYWATKLREQLR